MRTFVVKLAAWHRLCKELEQAQLRLASQPDAMGGSPLAMTEDVRRLRRACDHALGELRAAADAYMKAARQADGTTPVARQAFVSRRWGDGLDLLKPAQNLFLG